MSKAPACPAYSAIAQTTGRRASPRSLSRTGEQLLPGDNRQLQRALSVRFMIDLPDCHRNQRRLVRDCFIQSWMNAWPGKPPGLLLLRGVRRALAPMRSTELRRHVGEMTRRKPAGAASGCSVLRSAAVKRSSSGNWRLSPRWASTCGSNQTQVTAFATPSATTNRSRKTVG